jgi:pyridinium-3,5-biscarboxylic acid mononucleotide synthase
MKEILDLYKSGLITDAEAKERIMKMFYERGEEFMLDMHRKERLGFPEVVLAEGKSTEQVLDIVERMLSTSSPILISNVSETQTSAIETKFALSTIQKAGRMIAVGPMPEDKSLGTVGVITAGTSDIPFARECILILEATGAKTLAFFDAGVAGIHRPYLSLTDVKDAEVLIILAGMEGALPTLIASVTDRPVIAVPTPVGYGIGGGGIGAMISMLQTCAPGVVTVNIGNTIGASAAAIRILRIIRRASNDKNCST